MPRQTGPHCIDLTFELQRDEAVVSEQTVDRCDKRPEREAIAARERRRGRAIFGA